MAQRDLAIVKGGQEISELAEQYQKLMAAQGYFEEEMQRFESQLKVTKHSFLNLIGLSFCSIRSSMQRQSLTDSKKRTLMGLVSL